MASNCSSVPARETIPTRVSQQVSWVENVDVSQYPCASSCHLHIVSETALRTLQAASVLVQNAPGSTVHVMPGTYRASSVRLGTKNRWIASDPANLPVVDGGVHIAA